MNNLPFANFENQTSKVDKELQPTQYYATLGKKVRALEELLKNYQLIFSDIPQEDLHWIDWERISKAEQEFANLNFPD